MAGIVWLAALVGLLMSAAPSAPVPSSIRERPEYAKPERTLQQLVAEKGRRRINHFCVVAYASPNGEQHAWVHWRDENALILWEPVADRAHVTSLATSRRYLRLDRDVVASPAALSGSTYMVTRAWVDEVIGDCERYGDKFEITGQRKGRPRTGGR